MFYFSSAWLTTLYAMVTRYEQQLLWLQLSEQELATRLEQLHQVATTNEQQATENHTTNLTSTTTDAVANTTATFTATPNTIITSSLNYSNLSNPPFPYWDFDSVVNYALLNQPHKHSTSASTNYASQDSVQHTAQESDAELISQLGTIQEYMGTTHDAEYWYRLWYARASNLLATQAQEETNNSYATATQAIAVEEHEEQQEQNELAELATIQNLLRSSSAQSLISNSIASLKQQLLELIAACQQLEADITSYTTTPLTVYSSKNSNTELLIYHCNKYKLYQVLYNQAELNSHPTYKHGLLPAILQAEQDGTQSSIVLYGIHTQLDLSGISEPLNLPALLEELEIIKKFVAPTTSSHKVNLDQGKDTQVSETTPTSSHIPIATTTTLPQSQLPLLEKQLRTKIASIHLIHLQLQRANRDREFRVVTKVLRTCIGWLPRLICKDLPRALRSTSTRKTILRTLVAHLQHTKTNQAVYSYQLESLAYAVYSYFMNDLNNWLIQTLQRKQQLTPSKKNLVWNYWYANKLSTGWISHLVNSWRTYNFIATPREQIGVTWLARDEFTYALIYHNQLESPSLVHDSNLAEQRNRALGFTLAHYHHWGIELKYLDWTRWWLSNPTDCYQQQLHAQSTQARNSTSQASHPTQTLPPQVLIPDLSKAEFRGEMGAWADTDLQALQTSLNDYVKHQYGIFTEAEMQALLQGYQDYFSSLALKTNEHEAELTPTKQHTRTK